MFMLLGHGAHEPKTGLAAKIDKQIFIYIRGKVCRIMHVAARADGMGAADISALHPQP